MDNLTEQNIIEILRTTRNIAVVGLSPSPYRASYGVASYLLNAGYNIIPVNPNYPEVLGRQCYPSLKDVPGPVDLVDVFRNPTQLGPVIEDVIASGIKTVWLQLGVINPAASRRATEAGLTVVEDRCLKIEHARYRPRLGS